jgi:hypothetical protein
MYNIVFRYHKVTCFGADVPSSYCCSTQHTSAIVRIMLRHIYLGIIKKVLIPEENKKRITLNYVGKETRSIAKLFKYSNIRAAFRTKNTTENFFILEPKDHKYNNGFYQLKCSDSNKNTQVKSDVILSKVGRTY